MGFFDRWRARKDDIHVRCGMCRVETDYPLAQRGQFVFHSCDSDVFVERDDPTATAAALDLFVRAFASGALGEAERVAARDRLLYELGEAPIAGLEDVLWRMKYAPRETWPFPEFATRFATPDAHPRIDWSNELEMYLHRMKKYAITKRQLAAVGPDAQGILRDKLERLKTAPLVPLEED
jgi:hypothetical protein